MWRWIRGMAWPAALSLLVGSLSLVAGSSLALAYYHSAPTQAAPAASADAVKKQLQTAAFHAKNASSQGTLASAVLHLGHALNCIEGPKGANFDASWGNVCEGQGQGIAVDLQGLPQAGQVRLLVEAADALALAGVKAGDLAATRNAARGVAALLELVAGAM